MACAGEESKVVTIFKRKPSNSEKVDVELSTFDNVKTLIHKLGEKPGDIYIWMTSYASQYEIQKIMKVIYQDNQFVETEFFKKAVKNNFVIDTELDDVDSELIDYSVSVALINSIKDLKILKPIGFKSESNTLTIDPFGIDSTASDIDEVSFTPTLESVITNDNPSDISVSYTHLTLPTSDLV